MLLFFFINLVAYLIILKINYLYFKQKIYYPFRLAELFALIIHTIIVLIVMFNFFEIKVMLLIIFINFLQNLDIKKSGHLHLKTQNYFYDQLVMIQILFQKRCIAGLIRGIIILH